jgi:tellurite resistance protein TehA-like permease
VVLWLTGTALGLLTAVAVPYRLFTRLDVPPDGAFGGWLMPVVPPMVSAATGALLVPYTPAGQLRQILLLSCYAMFGMTLLASVVIITLLWNRLAQHKVGPAAMVPTLWIVLGPLGQSITAANNLGTRAALALPSLDVGAFRVFGLVYGVPVWGFALMWIGLAGGLTVRAARSGLPFTLSWWSFVFPVGTVVTGTSTFPSRRDRTCSASRPCSSSPRWSWPGSPSPSAPLRGHGPAGCSGPEPSGPGGSRTTPALPAEWQNL